MRFLLADLKRGCTEPRFFLALILGVGCALVSGAIILSEGGSDGLTLFTKAHSLALPFVAPLLCALPYSNMVMLEESTKFDRLMALRLGRKTWLFHRFFVNGLLSALAITVPNVALLLLSLVAGGGAFTLSVAQVLGLNLAFGFAFGTLSYGLCFVNTQPYIPLVAPQVVYLFCIYAFPIVGWQAYFPPLAFAPWIAPSLVSWPNIGLFLAVLTALGLALVIVGQVRQEVDK